MDKINFIVKDSEKANFSIESGGTIKVYPPLDDIEIEPTKETQIFKNSENYGYDNIIVNPIPDNYIEPKGTLTIRENSVKNVREYENVVVNVPEPEMPEFKVQEKEITPTKEVQTVTPDTDYKGLSEVKVNPIPDEYIIPKLEHFGIEIIENGTNTVTASEGFDGIGSIEITTNIKGSSDTESSYGEYIQDGLIAWFEGEDELVNNTLVNRLGNDYIQNVNTVGSVKTKVYNPWTKAFGSKAISNNMSTVYGTSIDYYNTGYTYEAVGEITNINNDVGTSGGWLFASNNSGGFGIGVATQYGEVYFLNNSNCTKDKTYTNYYGKRFGASVYTKDVGTRSSLATIYDLECSVNGEPYYNIKQTVASTKTTKANTLSILNYYSFSATGSKYATNGHLYSLRIYNRRLSEEEIAHNHEIDKKRFKLHDYVEE